MGGGASTARPDKLKHNLKIAAIRLNQQKGKRHNLNAQQKREVSELLRRGHAAAARARSQVMRVVSEDYAIEALDAISWCADMLLTRLGAVEGGKEPKLEVAPYVGGLVFAAATHGKDVPELSALRAIFASLFGSAYMHRVTAGSASEAELDPTVLRVLRHSATLPTTALADQYLEAIAKSYDVAWTPPAHNAPPAGTPLTSEAAMPMGEPVGGGAVDGAGANPAYVPQRYYPPPPTDDELAARLYSLRRVLDD